MINEKEAVKRIENTLGDDYAVVSTTMREDTYSSGKATIHHNTCGSTYTTRITNVVQNKRKCPVCSSKHKVNESEAVDRIQDKYGDEYTFLEDYKGYSVAIDIKHKCGNIIHVKPSDLVLGNNCKECTYIEDHTEPIKFVEEEWLPYKDTGYSISNTGKVKNSRGNLIKAYRQPTGYYKVNLHVKGKSINLWRYHMVAETFIDNPESLPMVNHIDESHDNDRIDNLQWCTARYNSNYGTIKKRRTGMSMKGSPVYAIFKDGTDMYFKSLTESSEYFGGSVTTSHISNVLRGNQRTTGGLVFERA